MLGNLCSSGVVSSDTASLCSRLGYGAPTALPVAPPAIGRHPRGDPALGLGVSRRGRVEDQEMGGREQGGGSG